MVDGCYWAYETSYFPQDHSAQRRDIWSKFLKITYVDYAFFWYGDFLGGLCQYVKSDQTAKRFNESFLSLVIMTKRIFPTSAFSRN